MQANIKIIYNTLPTNIQSTYVNKHKRILTYSDEIRPLEKLSVYVIICYISQKPTVGQFEKDSIVFWRDRLLRANHYYNAEQDKTHVLGLSSQFSSIDYRVYPLQLRKIYASSHINVCKNILPKEELLEFITEFNQLTKKNIPKTVELDIELPVKLPEINETVFSKEFCLVMSGLGLTTIRMARLFLEKATPTFKLGVGTGFVRVSKLLKELPK